jgi:cbb3-type cytochrome oxidase maturation protein
LSVAGDLGPQQWSGREGGDVTSLLFLIPASLCLGGFGLAAFLWALNSGQYEDLEGAALRVLDDADLDPRDRRDAV